MTHALITPSEELDETEVETVASEVMRFDRYWAVEDIKRGGADMREVTAYAAVFDQDSEIQDQHGHYIETIDRAAFRRTLSHPGAAERCQFIWNHGYHADGSPSAIASVPIGRLLEVKADDRGLLTRARFNKSDLAEHVLEAIKAGDVRGYSFRGRVFKSDPHRVPRIQRGGALPRVRRMELGLSDLGPTSVPWYSGSQIVAVRSRAIAEAMALPPRDRIVIARALLADEPDPEPATPEPDVTPEPVDEPQDQTPDTDEEPEVTTPDQGTPDAPTTPDADTDADESEEDDEDEDDAEVPEDAPPTPDTESGPGAEDPPRDEDEALLPADPPLHRSQAVLARRIRVDMILRSRRKELTHRG